jgi:hypothetical protein
VGIVDQKKPDPNDKCYLIHFAMHYHLYLPDIEMNDLDERQQIEICSIDSLSDL